LLDTISDPVVEVEKWARKPWITQEMISKMDERRKWKNVNSEESRKNYRMVRNELKRATDNAKRNILRTYVMKLWNFKEKGVMI
jgi:hypothetical protein